MRPAIRFGIIVCRVGVRIIDTCIQDGVRWSYRVATGKNRRRRRRRYRRPYRRRNYSKRYGRYSNRRRR